VSVMVIEGVGVSVIVGRGMRPPVGWNRLELTMMFEAAIRAEGPNS
jgi:hypothetical protein